MLASNYATIFPLKSIYTKTAIPTTNKASNSTKFSLIDTSWLIAKDTRAVPSEAKPAYWTAILFWTVNSLDIKLLFE